MGQKFIVLARDNFKMPIYKWLTQNDDQKIEDIRKYFLEPKRVVIENLIKLTKKNIKQCGVKIGELQEICDQEKIVVTEGQIKEIKEKIKKVQSKTTNIKAKRARKDKKLKRLLENEWENKEKYLTEEEVIRYIRYGRKNT